MTPSLLVAVVWKIGQLPWGKASSGGWVWAALGASRGFWDALVRYTLQGQSAASALECGQPGRLASQGKGKTALGNGLLASQLAAWF